MKALIEGAVAAASPSLLARPRQLVAPGCLRVLLEQGGALLLELGCGGAAAFTRDHIPGAAYLDTNLLEGGPRFDKVDDAALLRVLLAQGIRHDSTVIVYGRNCLAAARAAQLMLYAGVADVRLLDGGYHAWRALRLPTATGPGRQPRAVAGFGAAFPGRPDYLIDMAGARAVLARADAVLVSIRTWSEFIGQTSGYSYIAARGDIPGARWGRAGHEGDVNSMSHFQHANGCMLPAAAIAQQWRDAGIGADLHVAFYCGTGWRASLAFFYAWLMGWERISVYDGGWMEWSGDPDNAVVCRSAQPL